MSEAKRNPVEKPDSPTTTEEPTTSEPPDPPSTNSRPMYPSKDYDFGPIDPPDNFVDR
jgi:hypothetical protein